VGHGPASRQSFYIPEGESLTTRGDRGTAAREDFILVIVLGAAVGFVIASALLLQLFHQPPGFHDAPPPPPGDSVRLTAGNTTQWNITLWRTDFWVSEVHAEAGLGISNVTIRTLSSGWAALTGARVDYSDLDSDGNVTVGDAVSVVGMTGAFQGGWLVLSRNDTVLERAGISWDEGDPAVYAVWLYWVHPPEANGTGWDARFVLNRANLGRQVLPGELSYSVTAEGGTPLTTAAIAYEDFDRDGRVSSPDAILLYGGTKAYQGATLRVFVGGTLVGFDTIPHWPA